MDDLKIEDLKMGTGKEIVKGALIICHYEGKLDDGTIFDSSYQKNKPFQCVIGTGRVIKGWDRGLIGMKEGGVRSLYVPSSLAYAERQMGNFIKPHSNLHFVIELLEVRTRD